MTNSPTFDKQLALNDYWEEIGGLTMLPGTNRSADRFARASFYIKTLPKTDQANEAVAGVMSVMRNVSVPLTSSPTLALRVTGGGFPLLGDSCSRSTGFLLHRAA
ncbi:linear amide C-N hydrolase [Aeromonas caviae]|nr:linear amide C-N hydrolase [Aeromonas caviae]MCR3982898.1 linear amide C-N hydrolase [Aeromonas caviae]